MYVCKVFGIYVDLVNVLRMHDNHVIFTFDSEKSIGISISFELLDANL